MAGEAISHERWLTSIWYARIDALSLKLLLPAELLTPANDRVFCAVMRDSEGTHRMSFDNPQ